MEKSEGAAVSKSGKPITVRSVDSMAPGERLWDGGKGAVSGFYVRYRGDGGKKVYGLVARINGRQRWMTIGEHGSPFTPETARRRANELRGLIANGRDPAAEREQARKTLTVAEIAERFLRERCGCEIDLEPFAFAPSAAASEVAENEAGVALKTRGRKLGKTVKKGTANGYWQMLRAHVVPAIGKLRADTVSVADLAKLHHEMINIPRAANHMLACVSAMTNWAAVRGLWPKGSNPTQGIERYEEKSHERFLRPSEVQALGKALSTLDAEIDAAARGEVERENKHANKAQPRVAVHALAAVRLLVFTGMRPREVLTLKWEHVDVENRVINLKDAKTGDRQVTLGTAALKVLASIPVIEGNPFVIVGNREGQHVASLQHTWETVRKEAGLTDVRLYDLRHSYASTLAKGGAPVYEIQALLGHRNISTSMRYIHLTNDQVRSAADKANASIEAAMQAGTGVRKNVVSIGEKRGS